MSKVTIIIPVYATDAGDLEHLGECLESCARQAQIVVHDDGSLVDLAPIRRSFRHVTFGASEHRGKSYARNHAATLARSDLILPLDADDKLETGAVKTFLAAWRGVPLYSWIYFWYNEHTLTRHELPAFMCEHVTGIDCMSSVNVLHSKEQWAAVGGWDERYNLYEDWLYNHKLMWLFGGQLIPQALQRGAWLPSGKATRKNGFATSTPQL